MEHKSRRPVDWEALSSVTRPSCTAPLWPFWATPRRRRTRSRIHFSAIWKSAGLFLPGAGGGLDDPGDRKPVHQPAPLPWRRRMEPLPPELPAREAEARELEELYRLPPQDRAAIHLYYYEGYSTGEMASILGMSPARSAPVWPGPERS